MTKAKLFKVCRGILHNSPLDKPLSQANVKWLWNNVYKYHPNRDYKYEDIVSITPRHNWEYGNNNFAFWVETTDGNGDFWSFQKAIRNK